MLPHAGPFRPSVGQPPPSKPAVSRLIDWFDCFVLDNQFPKARAAALDAVGRAAWNFVPIGRRDITS